MCHSAGGSGSVAQQRANPCASCSCLQSALHLAVVFLQVLQGLGPAALVLEPKCSCWDLTVHGLSTRGGPAAGSSLQGRLQDGQACWQEGRRAQDRFGQPSLPGVSENRSKAATRNSGNRQLEETRHADLLYWSDRLRTIALKAHNRIL